MKIIKNILYFIISWTWGFIQSFVGLIMFFVFALKKSIVKIEHFNGSLIVFVRGFNGVSMGYFIFLKYSKYFFEKDRITVKHEYGHFLQHLMLGIFYILVVGIKSFFNNRMSLISNDYRGLNYYKRFPEKWADKLGKVERIR